MGIVFIVQAVMRFHCPECDGAYSQRNPNGVGFICNNCQHEYSKGILKAADVTPAAVYGKLEVLIQTRDIGIALQPLVAQMKTALKDFSDDDYIATVGDPVAIALAGSIAAKNNRGRVKYLRWDRQTRQYIKIQVEI